MSDRFEDFVKNNREDFDKFEPGPVVWHNIQQEMKKPAGKKGIVISMGVIRWSAAAAILLLVAGGAFFALSGKKNTPDLASNRPVDTAHQDKASIDSLPKDAPDSQPAIEFHQPDETQLAKTGGQESSEELYHYARLVEIKQNEIKKIKKDEPLLYQQFAGDFNKLDSTFHILKKQLPANPNREQILEAMIQNLQYQEALLNQQLNIIKKINNSKKEAYEKAYRSA